MKLFFTSLCLFVILISTSFTGFSQKGKSKFEIQLVGIPYYKLSNSLYENKMQQKSDYFRLDYSERINQEIGVNVKYNYKKWKFGIGVSYNTFNYDYSLYHIDFDNHLWQDLRVHKYQELNLTAWGIGLLAEREIFKSINLGMRVSLNNSIKNELTEYKGGYSWGSEGLSIVEYHNEGIKTIVIPEVFLSKNIYKGLDLIVGYKLKFYKSYKFPGEEIYSVAIKSDYEYHDIYNYTIDTYQAGFYFGASYTFQLPKFRKPKLD